MMQFKKSCRLPLVVSLTIGLGFGWMGANAMTHFQSDGYQVFALKELEAERDGKAWHEFLRSKDLYCGLYVLNAGSTDGQSPHNDDEVYYVLEGKAQIELGDAKESVPIKAGSVIYVKAHEHHKFHNITEDLRLLVFFATANS